MNSQKTPRQTWDPNPGVLWVAGPCIIERWAPFLVFTQKMRGSTPTPIMTQKIISSITRCILGIKIIQVENHCSRQVVQSDIFFFLCRTSLSQSSQRFASVCNKGKQQHPQKAKFYRETMPHNRNGDGVAIKMPALKAKFYYLVTIQP